MAGFMNAELEAIRDNLECGHCASRFRGSDSQARKVKYENRAVYCSRICRKAAFSKRGQEQALRDGKKLRKGVLSGPCKQCGKMYVSQIDKIFCSMACYKKSDQFRVMLEENRIKMAAAHGLVSEKLKRGQDVPCLECGTVFYQKRASKNRPARKYCSTVCYRSYMAKRFDRWVANPEGMALPQCYDEFLDREELQCIVDGCDWSGRHLSLHINLAHGATADEFKRAAGFNITTGVVARPLAELLRERSPMGVATEMSSDERACALELAHERLTRQGFRYKSLEAREHAQKAMALQGPGPNRKCAGCGKAFQQTKASGRALYCTPECRDRTYAERRRARAKIRTRQEDGTFKWVAPGDE